MTAMIQAALLSNLGIDQLDRNGQDIVAVYDEATKLGWYMVTQVEPGGPLIGNIIRLDPGTMGRTLFHFRTTPRDGRHGLDHIMMDGTLTSTGLPALPGLCAFIHAARREMEAGRVPDLPALAPQHLGMALALPPVEVRPGDRACRLDFGAPE